ncbi:hypothetical protein KG088_03215 [Halomonas sp. TRM85114]|uniref:hypothetical protein n=1 Tax=Halomonas jincaotanensis TaxID=2810616 RepID=UPI001BD31852|nr:hypothetical protein [Halomonas jincaotanensis]MBS9402628.1 hypothetical protein [Halomonas jincaotanensis]
MTHRSEKYREPTLRWLADNNIGHGYPMMSVASSMRKKDCAGEYAIRQADHYRCSVTRLLITKDEPVAKRVAERSGKPVLCLETSEVCRPGMESVAKHGKQHLARVAMLKLRRKLLLMTPDSTKQIMQRFYRKCFR